MNDYSRLISKSFKTYHASDDIIVRYLIRPKDKVEISSIADDFIEEFKGSWTNLPLDLVNKAVQYENYIYDLTINELSNYAYMSVGYPAANFDIELGGVVQLLSIIAGDNISSKAIDSIRITDIYIPKEMVALFKGPTFGIEGVRAIYNINTYPLLQMILKPRLGLSPDDYANIAYQAAIAGVDAIRDDQMLISTAYCSFYGRVDKISEALASAHEKTGKKVFYYPNVTLSPTHLPRIIEYLRDKEISCLTVNAIYEGIGIIEFLQKIAPDFIIQAHRSGYILLSNNRNFSISYSVIAQLLNLAGADEIHIGSIFGRFDVNKQDSLKCLDHICNPASNIKKSFPIISGSVTPAIISATLDEVSSNVIFMAGSGIIGHPLGIESGVRAIKEMIEIAMAGSGIDALLSNNMISEDLLHALHLWGYKKDGVNKDQRVSEKVRQMLQVNDSLDLDYREKKAAEIEYYKELFNDFEIGIISDSLSNSASVMVGSIGLITEKYIRKICNAQNVVFCQMFNGIKQLFECSFIDDQLMNRLNKIRIFYNKAKHKDIYISFKEAKELLDDLFYFFKWINDSKALIGDL